MLTIEIKINGRLVATASAQNKSGLADLSDYDLWFGERENDVAGTTDWNAVGKIKSHDRRKSVWALVHKIAGQASVVSGFCARKLPQ